MRSSFTGALKKGIKIAALSFVLLSPIRAFACASCGSGSGAPLILFPNERYKLYLGLGITGDFESIDTDSKIGRDGGPRRKDVTTLALGSRVGDSTFLTLTLPLVTNRLGSRTFSSLTDPILQLRHTLLDASITEPWIPQIQLVLGRREPIGLSIRDSSEDLDPIKVTSSGTAETEIGFDIWSGPGLIKWGTAHSSLLPQGRQFSQGLNYEPGLGYQSVLTIGVAKDGLGKLIGGLTRLSRERIRVNGEPVNGSEILSYSLFFTGEWWFQDLQSLRLTYVRSGFLTEQLGNKNASQSHGVTLAWAAATPNR